MRRRPLAGLAAAVVLVAGLVAGCDSDDVPSPGAAKIDVDTPHLRQLKETAGIQACTPGSGSATAVEGGLPAVTLPCLGGGDAVPLASLRGPMVVNLWASWCGPCVKEMPALAAFYDRYGTRVPVVGVDYQDNQTDAALDLAKKSGVTYPLLADPQGDLQGKKPFPGRMTVPGLVFVAADGSATLVPGGVTSAAELVSLVREHLGVAL